MLSWPNWLRTQEAGNLLIVFCVRSINATKLEIHSSLLCCYLLANRYYYYSEDTADPEGPKSYQVEYQTEQCSSALCAVADLGKGVPKVRSWQILFSQTIL